MVDPSGLWTTCYDWRSVPTDAGWETYCGTPVETTILYDGQVALDENGNWVPPSQIDDWENNDWYCNSGQAQCVAQIDLVYGSEKDRLKAMGAKLSELYDWLIASMMGAVPGQTEWSCGSLSWSGSNFEGVSCNKAPEYTPLHTYLSNYICAVGIWLEATALPHGLNKDNAGRHAAGITAALLGCGQSVGVIDDPRIT
jgi:hypothetical protein